MTMKLMPDRHVEVLEIEGMTCDHCVASVREALAGVSNAVVQSVEIGRAAVDAGPEATREQLVEAVEAVGFDVVGGTSEAAPE
jgi:copper chaperone CopZ